ncbi:enoyl-CoA hydratase-related protein [Mycobacteroides sp. LB1]|uniref:enoyl-CoA hydratase-related protein n=1 Tax=Mycobacteroides sp. LB1 TaxID=2750814 RepID=UPI0015DDDC67|nr:enoyl-CoA hydratase/isomerase family protein [Mycobacteroides sp. LB1]
MPVTIERHEQICVIQMNRPEKRNAINPEMTLALDAALNQFEDDADLWVAVLTGYRKGFCAGTDLAESSGPRTERGGEYGLIRRSRRKPLIAAVEGMALGGGMEMVLACDLVVASSSATFGLPEVRRGVIATCGGLFRAQRALPLNIARQILLTGDPITADRAYQLGLVNEVTEDGAALSSAITLAQRIVLNSPVSVQESLRAMDKAFANADDAGWTHTETAFGAVLQSADMAEGITAFFERRSPQWTGR